ncbi:hypothetical protein [Nitrosomonas ureae]|uniref:Uncharacterized protein n=1 Tax=Nitrosomonas ureae TaxID=44577 RepID=A0A286AKX8_9PROT|nr:hypothetical protein [Nitrosomonas ureae]SOD22553.1 hypothetical protein SAMN06297164_3506 [Nitrosomonas ureae]
MEMKTYIEMGEKKAGKQIELARILGIRDTTLRLAKSGKMGLPDAICIKLADYIETDRLEIIAASNLVTEKDEERIKIFKSCFTRAASIAVAALIFTFSSMTSSPAHAGQLLSEHVNNLYYVKFQNTIVLIINMLCFFDSCKIIIFFPRVRYV